MLISMFYTTYEDGHAYAIELNIRTLKLFSLIVQNPCIREPYYVLWEFYFKNLLGIAIMVNLRTVTV